MSGLPRLDEQVLRMVRLDPRQMLPRAEAGEGSYPQAWAAAAYARAGFQVVPLVPETKRLDAGTGFRHGRDARLPDVQDVWDLWYANPIRNVGLAPHPRMLVVDVDAQHGATLAEVASIGLDVENVYREHTPSGGYHLYYRLPKGVRASKGATGGALPPGVELLGPKSYAVAAHSVVDGNWYRHDPTGGLVFGRVPVGWPLLPRLIAPPTGASLRAVRKADRFAASNLIRRMRGAIEFREGVNGLFSPEYAETIAAIDPTLDRTPSGRDFLLVYLASHFVRHDPRRIQILFALLWSTRWPEGKTQRRPGTDPEEYCADTVSKAITARDAKDDQRLSILRSNLIALSQNPPLVSTASPDLADSLAAPSPLLTPPLLDGTLGVGKAVEEAVLALACGEHDDRFWPTDAVRSGVSVRDLVGAGWRRVPVEDLAALHGTSRKTVTRALKALEQRGVIERRLLTYRHDGGARRDSLVRLVEPAS